MIFALIAGIALTCLSLFVLRRAFGILDHFQARAKEHGINEPLPIDRGPAAVVLGWVFGLLVGIGLIVWYLTVKL